VSGFFLYTGSKKTTTVSDLLPIPDVLSFRRCQSVYGKQNFLFKKLRLYLCPTIPFPHNVLRSFRDFLKTVCVLGFPVDKLSRQIGAVDGQRATPGDRINSRYRRLPGKKLKFRFWLK